jgi:glutaredoxin
MPSERKTMVKIYTRTTCAPCRMVKTWLQKKGVKYEELNVDEKPELMDDVIRKTGLMMVPVTVIGENHVQGMNFSRLSELLMV